MKMQNKSYCAVQGHSRSPMSPMSAPIESLYVTFYSWSILTDILSRTFLKLSQIIFQILYTTHFGAPVWGLGATYTVHLRLIGNTGIARIFSEGALFL